MRTFLEGVAILGIVVGVIWLLGDETTQIKGAIFLFGGILTFMGDILAAKLDVLNENHKTSQAKLDDLLQSLSTKD